MKVIIIGAGIAGLSTAIGLKKARIKVELYEAAPAFKPLGAGLGLGANAIKGFMALGIEQDVIPAGKVMASFAILDHKARPISVASDEQLLGKHGIQNFTIHRAALHEVLLRHAQGIPVHLGMSAVSYKRVGEKVEVHFADGSQASGDLLIAADGIHSVIRRQLIPSSLPRYAGYTCWRGVVNNFDTTSIRGSETWGPQGRFGIVPLTDNQLYWFAVVNAKEGDPAFKSWGAKEIEHHFKNFHDPIPQIISGTPSSNIIHGDIYDMKPLKHFYFDRCLLIGDAAHATTPNLGQGACQAIEDAATLPGLISKMSLEEAMHAFELRRVARTRTIIERSGQLGKIAQWENKLMIRLRNSLFRMMPASFNDKQIDWLYNVSFD